MNVAFDPWIPVVTLDGKPKLASLCEVLTQGHLLADLSVRPHERVSLMRLFLCVAHAALDGPKDYDQWREVPTRLPDAAAKYLQKWKDSFELFHSTKPWLQIADLKSGKNGEETWTPLSKLSFFFATGDNSTLFDHEGANPAGRTIPVESIIVSLVAFQCFSPGGTMGRTFWRNALCGTPLNPKKANGPVKSEDGPCAQSSMLHALLRRQNLYQSLIANLPSHEDIRFACGETEIGKPVWEQIPNSVDDRLSERNCTSTHLGRLVPLTRFIRIDPRCTGMILGNGFGYLSYAKGAPPENTAIIVANTKGKKTERRLLSYHPGNAIWRELAAMIVKRNAEGDGGPLSLNSLGEGDACDLIVSAMARDQATILDTAESVHHISFRLRSNDGRSVYQAEIQKAEDLARRLGWAIEEYRKALDGGWEGRLKKAGPGKGELKAKLYSTASTQFWTTVEKNLALLMAHIDALGTDRAVPTREAWRTMFWKTACEAYQAVCGQETPRQIKAFVEGWKKLNYVPTEPKKKSKRKGAKE
jgi:CRISPR system Cascade subunit CasA